MLRRRLLPALPLLLVLLGAVAPVRAADPLQNGNIAMLATGPAAARQGYYDLQAQPGDRVDLPFVISNPSGQPVKAILFAADAATADGGGMALRTPEDPVVAAGTWLSPGAGTYTLAPGQKLPVTLTLDVPRDARPGQHLALAIARVLEDGADPGQAGRDELNLKINIAHQVVIGVMVTIPGPVAHDIKVTRIEHFYQAEQLWLRVRVRNDGTVIEHPGGDLRVYDGDGREVTTNALQMDSLYPGTEGGILVPVDRGMGRSGQYRASVTLHQAEQLPVQAEFPVLLSRHEVIVADAARYQKIKEQSTDDGMVLNREQVLLWSTVGSAALLLLTLGGAWLRRWRRPSALVPAAAGLPVLSSLSMVGTETDLALWLSRSARRRVGRRH